MFVYINFVCHRYLICIPEKDQNNNKIIFNNFACNCFVRRQNFEFFISLVTNKRCQCLKTEQTKDLISDITHKCLKSGPKVWISDTF